MSKGAKWFSMEEKERLRKELCSECEKYWRTKGYKKTGISELTKEVGISTGAFYSLFASKEKLFLQTIQGIQSRVKSQIEIYIKENPNKTGACNSLKYLFKEYMENPFLYDFSSPDFWALIEKLPKDQWKSIQQSNINFLADIVKKANLRFEVEPGKARAVLVTLLYTVTLKEENSYSRQEIFDFLLDCSFDKLFSQNQEGSHNE